MYGLCDCNNFFVSCERVFRPDLVGKPVVVLSNNDGCIIARSNEAKALGIGMGQPLYQVRTLVERHRVTLFSANHALYADLSHRVMATLRTLVPSLEIYSVDEAFFDLSGFPEPLEAFGRRIRETVGRHTGIPVSIGIAPTKTLAKVAARLAKNYPRLEGCCYMHREADIRKVLATFPLRDVWGIGRRYGRTFDQMHIRTAQQFLDLPEAWVRGRMGVTGLRTRLELQGVPAIGFDDGSGPRQQIGHSRTFPAEVGDRAALERIVAEFAARCAERLRRQDSVCRSIHCYISTNRHREGAPQRFETAVHRFAEPTASTLELVKAARGLLREIYRPGFGYKKAGVLLSDLERSEGRQPSLFGAAEGERQMRLMQALDAVNRTYGRGKVRTAAEGTQPFRMQSAYLSRRYTTEWDELLVVQAK